MSGYPNHNEVEQLKQALRELHKRDQKVHSIQRRINDANRELPDAEAQQTRAAKLVKDLLAKMDCIQTGNHGWEARYLTLLMRLAEEPPERGCAVDVEKRALKS